MTCQECDRLRAENAWLSSKRVDTVGAPVGVAERVSLYRLIDQLTAERDQARAERDTARAIADTTGW